MTKADETTPDVIPNQPISKMTAPREDEDDNVTNAVKKIAGNNPEKLMEFMAMGMSSVGNPLHQKMT